MTVNYSDVFEEVATYPEVVVNGRTILVKSGTFHMGGAPFTLAENENYEAPNLPDPTTCIGYLVRMKGGEIRLLVDEVSRVDPHFDFKTSGIECLQLVFSLDILPNEERFSRGRIKRSARKG